MWRTFFLAVAISICILGVECLAVRKMVLAKQVPVPPPPVSTYEYIDPLLMVPTEPQTTNAVVQPPEWAPWSLLSMGVIVMLYALSLKRGG